MHRNHGVGDLAEEEENPSLLADLEILVKKGTSARKILNQVLQKGITSQNVMDTYKDRLVYNRAYPVKG